MSNIFGLKPQLLSEYFTPDAWSEILDITADKVHILDLFKQNGLHFDVISEDDFVLNKGWQDKKTRELLKLKKEYPNVYKVKYTGSFNSVLANEFHPHIAKLPDKIYYHGYWINGNYFKEIRELILEELRFPNIEDSYNKGLAEKIRKFNSVAIHVRRGDFISFGWTLDTKWYESCTAAIKQKIVSPRFFIFSDEPDWCRKNMTTLGLKENDDVVFIQGNEGRNAFRDLQLMSMCKYMIIANSSFSYLGALLNKNKNKVVFNPTTRLIV